MKKVVLKTFAMFTEKFLCWSLFLISLQAWISASFLKRGSSTGFSLWILGNFQEHLFWKTFVNGCSWVEALNVPTSLQPLFPVNILTIKSKIVSPPPGEFSKPDIYCRKRWQCIQHICNEFSSQCKEKCLHSFQEFQKWEDKKRNFKIGDIVIVYQVNVAKSHWPMTRIIGVNKNKKGLICSVLLRMGERSGNENSKYELGQPIEKIVLIPGSDKVWFPTK